MPPDRFRAHPKIIAGVFEDLVHGPGGKIFARVGRRPEHNQFTSVETLQAIGGAHPNESLFVLQNTVNAIGSKSLFYRNARENILAALCMQQ